MPLSTPLVAIPTLMQAARLSTRGGPEEISVESATVPPLGREDALVAVVAAAITPSELEWEPTWTNTDGTDRRPTIPSHELSGIVVAIGADVVDVAVGAPVFALTDFYRDGGAAEFVAVAAKELAARPPDADPEAISALPLSGLAAWQALFDYGHVLADQRVFITGAAGGVGLFAVQLAAHAGARVIAAASPRDEAVLRGFGASEVVDGHADVWPIAPGSIDVVVDTVGGLLVERSWPLLTESGRLVSIAPSSRDIARTDRRGQFFIVAPDRGVLEELARLVATGALHVVIARTFALDATREAYEFARQEHPRGKVVLRVRP